MDSSAFRVSVSPFHRAAPARGYSLTNLVTTMAIAGIVTSGVPVMQNLVLDQRLVAHTSQIFGDLQLARSEAIKRGVQITLCKSSDGTACSTVSDWRDGWIVFADADGDETVDTGETILRVGQALSEGVNLRYGASYRYVYFKPDGTAWPNATFVFCDGRGTTSARGVIVWRTGRVRAWNASLDDALTCS